MGYVSKLFLFFFLLSTSGLFGQTSSDKLKKEQARLERKISATRMT
jgi:hypothetical protein